MYVVNILFQGTLVLLLFTDAAALHFSSWKKDAALPGRLLGIGLPLTIALGTVFAAVLFTDLSIWEAAIIGAITAPTDAALGQAVISNPRVPERIRQALDIEAGLNDGVSFPFVLIFIGLAGPDQGPGVVETFVTAIGVAVLVGIFVGVVGSKLLVWASKSGYMGFAWSSIEVIALAGTAFILSDSWGGSGFIAAFVAGLSYGEATRDQIKANEALAATIGLALVQVSFLAFGALIVEPAFGSLTWQVIVMAVLSLTIARIGPVALAMTGTKLNGVTILYMGWFGPRGLAAIVFAALVVTDADLPGTPTINVVAAVIVGMSVLLHGLSAYPGSQAYANWYQSHDDPTKLAEGKAVHHRTINPRLRHAMDKEMGASPPDSKVDGTYPLGPVRSPHGVLLLGVPFASSAFAFFVAQAIPLFALGLPLGLPLGAFAVLLDLSFGLVAVALDPALLFMEIMRRSAPFIMLGIPRLSPITLLAPLFPLPISIRLFAIHESGSVSVGIRSRHGPR